MAPYDYAAHLVRLSNIDDAIPSTNHCFGVHQRSNGKWQSRKTGYKVRTHTRGWPHHSPGCEGAMSPTALRSLAFEWMPAPAARIPP